ncbi:MAG: LPD38 domain-containing protein, partial [Pseudohongiellaceae bacterium]
DDFTLTGSDAEADQAAARGQQSLFSRSQETRDEYELRIDALYDGGPANRVGATVLDSSDVLGMLGYSDYPVRVAEGKIREGQYNHNLTAEHWKKIPEWLDDPVAVFESDTVEGRLVAIAPETTADGDPIVMVLEPDAGVDAMDVHLLVNAYDRTRRAPIQRWVDEGKYLYGDDKRIPAFNRSSGLRLPRVSDIQQGYGSKIYARRDLVKRRNEQGGDIRFSRAAYAPEVRSTQTITTGGRTRTRIRYADGTEEVVDGRGPGVTATPDEASPYRGDSTGFAVPDDTLVSVAVRKMQDKFKFLKDLQANIREAGGEIDEASDAYLAEELFHGKAENDIRILEERYVDPIARKMARFNISREKLDRYLYAKHAPERNAHIASINPDMQEGGSGMTDQEAAEILSSARKEGKADQYEQLSMMVYDMLRAARDMVRRSGLESEGMVDAWESQYEFYVPLKGWADDTKDQGVPGRGKGYSIGGRESKRAMGRSTEAASPLSYAIGDVTNLLIRKRKNEVGNALLNLVLKNPNKDFWSVYTDENPDTDRRVVKVRNEAGEVVEQVREMPIPMALMKDRYFETKRGGKSYYIKLEDERLMRAMKNLGPESNGALIRTLAGINRVLSALNTSYSPEFVVSNFSRDVQTAILNLQAEQSLEEGKASGERITQQTIKSIPTAMAAIHASLRGKQAQGEARTWQRYFDQFRADGAKTGWFDMKDLDQQAANVDEMVNLAAGGTKASAVKIRRTVTDLVENMNTAVENAVRLSAYVNAIRAGIPRSRAASLAKNMTVNFNRRGEAGTLLNALYMFSNASIQGVANFVRTMGTLKGDKKLKWENLNNAQLLAIGITAGAYMLSMANRMSAGEDDDEENWYDKVPDYVRERNLVIMKSLFGGPQDGSYWKIPLPYGYNAFYVLGDSMEGVFSGARSPLDAASDLTLATLGSFSPIGFQDSETLQGLLLKNAAPTIVKPVVEIGLNENFMGSSIYSENFPFGIQKPDSSLGRRSTPMAYKELAKWMNRVTGGSEYREGAIDVNPDVMQYLINYFGGSAYSFFGDKVPDAAYRAATGVPVEDYRIPFYSRITGQVLHYDDMDRFYQRRNTVEQFYQEAKSLPARERMAFLQKHGDTARMRGMVQFTEKKLSTLRDRRDFIYSMDLDPAEMDRRLKTVEEQMKAVVDRFNRTYNERT